MSKREELREKNRKKQAAQRTLLIVLGVAVVLIVTGLLIYPSIQQSMQPIGDIKTVTPITRANEKGLVIGPDNAPVKIIEFADFQCPACKQYEDQLSSTMLNNYVNKGKVQLTFVPDSFIGAESEAAAEAALCANDQGKFWLYHDMLYANQGSENSGGFSNRRLAAFAQTIGLDTAKFNSCFNSHKYQAQVAQDVQQATDKAVDRTPSFNVNGTNVFADTLFKTIDAELAKAPTK